MNDIIAVLKKKIMFNIRSLFFKTRHFYNKKKMGPEGPKKEFVLNKNIEWFGTSYGGFFLDKSLASKKSVLFSFGIGTDISFDRCVSSLGVKKIYLFDPTPIAIKFIKDQRLPSYYKFFDYGLSLKDETTEFILPTSEFISGSMIYHNQLGKGERINVDFKKLSTICNDLDITPDILKIDIEGSEFEIIEDIFKSKIFPKQICIEFHSRFFDDGKNKLENSLKLFAKYDYTIAGKSTEEEYLFIRK